MPEALKLSQIGSSPLPPLIRGLRSPGVKKTLSNYLRLLFPEIVYYGERLSDSELRFIVVLWTAAVSN